MCLYCVYSMLCCLQMAQKPLNAVLKARCAEFHTFLGQHQKDTVLSDEDCAEGSEYSNIKRKQEQSPCGTVG